MRVLQVAVVVALFAVLVAVARSLRRTRKTRQQALDEARAHYHEDSGYGEGCFDDREAAPAHQSQDRRRP